MITARGIDHDLKEYDKIIHAYHVACAAQNATAKDREEAWNTACAEFRKLGIGWEFAAKWLRAGKGKALSPR